MRKYRYKVVDEESDLVFFDDQVTTRWDGAIVGRRNDERDHPQKYIRPTADDPTPTAIQRPQYWPPINIVAPQELDYDSQEFEDYTSELEMPIKTIGLTGIKSPEGPASHLFIAGIERMTVEDDDPRFSFKVRDLKWVPKESGHTAEPAQATAISREIGIAIIEGVNYRFEVL